MNWRSLLERDAHWSSRMRLDRERGIWFRLAGIFAHTGDSWFWLAGLGLVWLALFRPGRHPLLLFCLAAVALLAHGYRLWEYLAHSPNPFCANFPLFTVNNIKLLGLLLIVILALVH
jgi:hypothetical protein